MLIMSSLLQYLHNGMCMYAFVLGKLQVLDPLLRQLKVEGHRLVYFCTE